MAMQISYRMEPNKRRNFLLGVINGAAFEISAAFLGTSTIIPVYLSNLTDASWVIGLAAAICSAGWLLPQFFLARTWENRPYKRPLYLYGSIIRNLSLLGASAVAFFLSTSAPSLALVCFLLLLSGYALGGGFCGLPFMEIVSKTIPNSLRARFFSLRFFLGGIGAFGSGFVIRWILSNSQSFPYPSNYGIILICSTVAMFIGTCTFLRIQEPRDERDETQPPQPFREYLKTSLAILRDNRDYSRYLLFRLCCSGHALSLPFYAKNAINYLDAPEALVGIFVSAQTIGAVLSNLVWGPLGDKKGNHVLLRTASAVALLAPLLALISPAIIQVLGAQIGIWLFVAIFPLVGAAFNGDTVGNWGYLLDTVPDTRRSTYIGLTNTFSAFFALSPILGGVIADLTSYPFVFCISVILLSVANLLAWRLKNTKGIK